MTDMQEPRPKLAAALSMAAAMTAIALRLARVPNVSAVGALSLYAGGRLPMWLAWLPPICVMTVSDVILSYWLAYPVLNPWVYASFLFSVLLGRLLARSDSAWRIGTASVL